MIFSCLLRRRVWRAEFCAELRPSSTKQGEARSSLRGGKAREGEGSSERAKAWLRYWDIAVNTLCLATQPPCRPGVPLALLLPSRGRIGLGAVANTFGRGSYRLHLVFYSSPSMDCCLLLILYIIVLTLAARDHQSLALEAIHRLLESPNFLGSDACPSALQLDEPQVHFIWVLAS